MLGEKVYDLFIVRDERARRRVIDVDVLAEQTERRDALLQTSIVRGGPDNRLRTAVML